MDSFIFAAMLLLPFAGGLYMFVLPFRQRRARNIFVFIISCAVSALVLLNVFMGGGETMTLITMDAEIALAFRMDGLGRVFAVIVALLWPIAVLFGFEYMKTEGSENRFFAFYTLTYGVVLGVAFAENYFTLYLFYELLTICTLPLVMHSMDGKARFAGKKYIIYSMSGAALCFIAMILLLRDGGLSYSLGGRPCPPGAEDYYRVVFLLAFFGFGAKAAIVPLHSWLPTAGVAPTPVTALLHAVAVVNAGAFAILRLIYYTLGTEVLSGSWAQTAAMAAACVTIVYGSVMALRNRNLKRRLAYSTVSNLSYIVLAAVLMCPEGLAAALMHMVVHSAVKITLFFCAGALLCATHHHKKNLEDYEGLGRRLPIVFAVFTLASLALIGIPPLAGFTSKWFIAAAAVSLGTPMAIVGCASLAVSAFLTALYLLEVVVSAFFPLKTGGAPETHIEMPGWRINASLIILAALILAVSFGGDGIYSLLRAVVGLS